MNRYRAFLATGTIRRIAPTLVLLVAVLCVCGVAYAQQTTQPATTTAPAVNTPADQYEEWVLVPPLVAIILAVITRQVIGSLFVATLVAAYMLMPCAGPASAYAGANPVIGGLRLGIEHYVLGAINDLEHIQIMVFTLCIGGMVGVVSANGGTRAIVEVLSRWARTPRRGQVAGWVGGHAVFFDDYANTMIVGPTFRPLYDRLRISRAKLAYIVDSTAAPVASLAPIGTWIGAEIGYIDDGLKAVKASATAAQPVPEFIEGVSAYHAFLASIGYRFYAIFALALVLIIALARRDFGPMKRAEREAASADRTERQAEQSDSPNGKPWYAAIPVLLLVGTTITILYLTGRAGFPEDKTLSFGTLSYLLVNADAYSSILYGAVTALVVAILIGVVTRSLPTRKAIDAALDGMNRMFPAIVILILAWSLSAATQDLQLGKVAKSILQNASFPVAFLPLAVFAAACVVSFATGSSWGTMGILCPAAVEIAAGMCGALPADQALPLFYSTVGAVLAGAIFGDHCSPISDTTVLSSIASSCKHETHVWTQIPYSLLAAAVSVGAGYVMCNIYGQPWWLCLLAGLALLVVMVLIIGRRLPNVPATAPQSSDAAVSDSPDT